MRPHETAVADNWSAVEGRRLVGIDFLLFLSCFFASKKTFNLKEINCEEHIEERNFYHESKSIIIQIIIIIIIIILYI